MPLRVSPCDGRGGETDSGNGLTVPRVPGLRRRGGLPVDAPMSDGGGSGGALPGPPEVPDSRAVASRRRSPLGSRRGETAGALDSAGPRFLPRPALPRHGCVLMDASPCRPRRWEQGAKLLGGNRAPENPGVPRRDVPKDASPWRRCDRGGRRLVGTTFPPGHRAAAARRLPDGCLRLAGGPGARGRPAGPRPRDRLESTGSATCRRLRRGPAQPGVVRVRAR